MYSIVKGGIWNNVTGFPWEVSEEIKELAITHHIEIGRDTVLKAGRGRIHMDVIVPPIMKLRLHRQQVKGEFIGGQPPQQRQ
jgi:hypothetical protein